MKISLVDYIIIRKANYISSFSLFSHCNTKTVGTGITLSPLHPDGLRVLTS